MKTLLIITGPTGVGKTELSLRVAERLGCPIVSCDSRQIYRELPIGTAAPTAAEQARVRHYMVGTHSLQEDYNAGMFERDALRLLDDLFREHEVVVMTGGSMLYIDAVCRGLDEIPAVPQDVRERVRINYKEHGLGWLQAEVERLDPEYWQIVDRQNPARLMHCVELCLLTGGTYTALRRRQQHERPFRILKIGLNRPRPELYDRINRRVDQMMQDGLEVEARSVYAERERNSLQTVGYRELFAYMDGEYDLERAVELIKQNTRHYAKRQMTWFNRDTEICWLDAGADYETNCTTIIDLLRHDGVQEDRR